MRVPCGALVGAATNIWLSLSHVATVPEVVAEITIVLGGTEKNSSKQPTTQIQCGVTIATLTTICECGYVWSSAYELCRPMKHLAIGWCSACSWLCSITCSCVLLQNRLCLRFQFCPQTALFCLAKDILPEKKRSSCVF